MALTPSQMVPLGVLAPDFDLTDPRGRRVRLADFLGRPLLVMFICNHCPFVKHLAAPLGAFAAEYAKKGLAVVGINSNDTESYPDDAPPKMKAYARESGWSFPYLIDSSQETAKAYRAACTPDFFLYDASHRLRYRGQFDDSRPESGIPITGEDLRAAADAVLAGRTPSADQKASIGCNIKWRPDQAPPDAR
jgi:peroxiredoxin